MQADHLFQFAPGKNLYLLCLQFYPLLCALRSQLAGFAHYSLHYYFHRTFPPCILCVICREPRVCECAFICILHAINHFIQFALSVRSVHSEFSTRHINDDDKIEFFFLLFIPSFGNVQFTGRMCVRVFDKCGTNGATITGITMKI